MLNNIHCGSIFFINEPMAMISKIHAIADTTVSTEQYHNRPDWCKAPSPRSGRVAKQQVCAADKWRAVQPVTTQPVQSVDCGLFSTWFALCCGTHSCRRDRFRIPVDNLWTSWAQWAGGRLESLDSTMVSPVIGDRPTLLACALCQHLPRIVRSERWYFMDAYV